MNRSPRWDPAVSHRGAPAEAFIKDYFGQQDRRVLLIGGAGFDPRAPRVCELLANAAPGRVHGFFIREERPRSDSPLRDRAERNIERLRGFVAGYAQDSIEIISGDGAVVGGHRIGPCIRSKCDFSDCTDIVVDVSALSKGISFPLVRGLLDASVVGNAPPGRRLNLHVMVFHESRTDALIVGEASDRAEVIVGFQGKLDHDDTRDAARLWLPQLTKETGTQEVLRRIYQRIGPQVVVCPVLPFPSFHPRYPDELVEFHGQALQNEWLVDARDLVYADEKSPLDLYRTILRIDDARQRVFAGVGGSLSILSPIGSKALAVGALLAAIERDFPVVYVEATSYSVDLRHIDSIREQATGEVIHVWLHGEVYPAREETFR
jgi:hypothetical protein